jgi:hypothetical protein
MSRFLEAQVALDKRLNAMTGVPPIARENSEYTPTEGVLYVRPTNLPAGSAPIGMANSDSIRTVGIYQIDVFAPLGNGPGPALTVADAIAEHFSRGVRLVNGDSTVILGVPAQQPARPSGAWFMVSVVIPYDNIFRS